MSWLKIDDGFEDHAKVEPLSDAAHRLWSRAACWCKKTGSDGFVPRRMLSTIAKNSAPPTRLEALAKELVDATAGGVYEHGLWEPTEDGWKFHDWVEYQQVREYWSTANYEEVYRRDGTVCRYCGSVDRLTIDHVTPRCQGGSDDADNLVVACRSCNSRKGGRTPEQAGMVLQ